MIAHISGESHNKKMSVHFPRLLRDQSISKELEFEQSKKVLQVINIYDLCNVQPEVQCTVIVIP
jgi:hypothetical protein